MSKLATIELRDQMPEEGKRPKKIKVTLETVGGRLLIRPHGHGDFCSDTGHGTPVLLEVCEGVLCLHVWSDINTEEGETHRLDGALERQRVYTNRKIVQCTACECSCVPYSAHKHTEPNGWACMACWERNQ